MTDQETRLNDITEVIEDVAKTLADPSPTNLLADLELGIRLAKKFKAQMAGLHPDVIETVKKYL
jgi:hypothetical protein